MCSWFMMGAYFVVIMILFSKSLQQKPDFCAVNIFFLSAINVIVPRPGLCCGHDLSRTCFFIESAMPSVAAFAAATAMESPMLPPLGLLKSLVLTSIMALWCW